MISKEIMFTLSVDKKDFMLLIYSPLNLVQFWKYLREIKIIDENQYVAKFKIFMNFNFKMRRMITINSVIHEDIIDFPKAMFRFTVNVIDRKGGILVTVKGEYQGPLEFLAKSPMQSFLENFRDKVIEYYEKKQTAYTFQELFKKLSEDSKGKEIVGVVEVNGENYILRFKNGEFIGVDNENVNKFLEKVLSSNSLVKLLREEEVYKEEYDNLQDLLSAVESESENKEVIVYVEANGRVHKLVVKNGKIVYNDVDPTYKGKLRVIEVNES